MYAVPNTSSGGDSERQLSSMQWNFPLINDVGQECEATSCGASEGSWGRGEAGREHEC